MYAPNDLHVETPVSPLVDIPEFHAGRFSSHYRSKAEDASVSSDGDQSDCSEEDRPLMKKSSLRSRGSPPANKSVSFNQSVMRQTDRHRTVECLKPAAEPMSAHWYSPHCDNEYYPQYYQRGSYHHQMQGHHQQYFPQRRNYSKNRRNGRRRNDDQSRANHCSGPSAMLSAWIDRDTF